MEISIKNCANIKKAEIKFKEGKRTLVLANNGTGKSTIIKAIKNKVRSDSLEELTSYNPKITDNPSIVMTKVPKSILVFDEDYSKNFVFVGNTILDSENTFQLLFENDSIRKLRVKVEETLISFNQVVASELQSLKKDLKEFTKISSSSKANLKSKTFVPLNKYKGLKQRNPLSQKKVVGIYSDILKSIDDKANWLKWREKYNIVSVEDNHYCPYCAQKLLDNSLTKISNFNSNVDVKAVEHRQDAKEIINSLSGKINCDFKVFENVIDKGSMIKSKTINKSLFKLSEKIEKIYNLICKLEKFNVKDLYNKSNSIDLTDININKLKDLENFEKVKSSFEELKKENRKLNSLIKGMNKNLVTALNDNTVILNKFCNNTGIPYEFTVKEVNYEKMVNMNYLGTEEEIISPQKKLSYGEKNAISAIIFGLIAKQQKTELVVLDDPFSSFDEFKTHFIYEAYFTKKSGLLKGKTVVYLTHSTYPVFDLIYHKVPSGFDYCYSLSNNNGNIETNKIQKKDIKNFKKSLINKINDSDNSVVKLVYLRKIIEVLEKVHANGKENNSYYPYHYISSFIKGAPPSIKISRNNFKGMTNDEIDKSINKINHLAQKYKLKEIDLSFNETEMKSAIEEIDELNNLEVRLIYLRYLLKREELESSNSNSNKKGNNHYFLNVASHYEKDKLLCIDPDLYNIFPIYIEEMISEVIAELKNKYN